MPCERRSSPCLGRTSCWPACRYSTLRRRQPTTTVRPGPPFHSRKAGTPPARRGYLPDLPTVRRPELFSPGFIDSFADCSMGLETPEFLFPIHRRQALENVVPHLGKCH